MRRILSLLLLALALTAPTLAQEIRYISDEIYVPLRKGPGNEFGWRAKLTPGRQLTVNSTQGEWTEVTTSRGTTGWVLTEHLSNATPAQVKLPQAEQRAASLSQKNSELAASLSALQAEHTAVQEQLANTGTELDGVSRDLTQLKKLSGNAEQLDSDNRRLTLETEELRAEVDMLEAESQRLQDKLDSEAFLNGALAVLLGVIITLVVPRLIPKRRKSSSWA